MYRRATQQIPKCSFGYSIIYVGVLRVSYLLGDRKREILTKLNIAKADSVAERAYYNMIYAYSLHAHLI